MPFKIKDRTGIRYGRLVVVKFAYQDYNRYAYWNCKCDCRKEITVRGSNLQSGGTKSCGCYKQEKTREIMIKRTANQLGKNNPNYIHGGCCNGNYTKVILKLKEKIRKQANYKCQECCKTQKQNLKETSEILSVHHIDGNDTNNKEENMIALCKNCHMKKPKGVKNEKENEDL